MHSLVAIFDGVGLPFRFEEVAIPALQPGEMLVKNDFTTICRSDLLTFTGQRTEKTPTILGHEVVGHVVDMHHQTKHTDWRGQPLSVGSRLTWAIYASNPRSVNAKKGIPQKGENLFKYGHERVTPQSHLHGGLSEYTILRQHTPVIGLDDTLSNPSAALLNCAVATVAGALRLCGDVTNKRVLVSGTGMLGTVACAMAKSGGADTVIAIDAVEERAQNALTFGADLAFGIGNADQTLAEALTAQHGPLTVDVALDFSGQPAAMHGALGLLDIGGTAVWMGATFPQQPVAVNAEQMVRKVLTIKGLHNYNASDLATAVAFMETYEAQYKFERLVYHPFGLHQCQAAFEYALAHHPFRVGISLVTSG